ncbi:MAG: prepilin-type N-terminal cleavage/methylation domain-containing protein, partial [Planctomycetota bacterium]
MSDGVTHGFKTGFVSSKGGGICAGTRCTCRRVASRRSGFTLLEVVAAVFIFLMGVVGVISLFASATVFHKDACDKTLCALLIEQVVDEIDGNLKSGALRDPNGRLRPVKDGTIRGYDRYGYDA